MKNKGLEMCTHLCATLKIPVWLWKTPEINVFTKLNCRWTTTVPVKENVNIWLALFEWSIINSLISFYCMRSSWLKMCTPPLYQVENHGLVWETPLIQKHIVVLTTDDTHTQTKYILFNQLMSLIQNTYLSSHWWSTGYVSMTIIF
jgi:hypothetical protein